MSQQTKGITWIPLATHPYGWNVKAGRPALKAEMYQLPGEVCLCDYCADEPHYGSHYCKRYGESNERFYSDHQSRW